MALRANWLARLTSLILEARTDTQGMYVLFSCAFVCMFACFFCWPVLCLLDCLVVCFCSFHLTCLCVLQWEIENFLLARYSFSLTVVVAILRLIHIPQETGLEVD